jgi:NitT/TauT family transport system substrate-binding protein
VDKDPNALRALLVDKARLPEPLKDTYVVNTYPTAQLPKQEEVAAILDWMKAEKLLTTDVTYADLMWTAPAK